MKKQRIEESDLVASLQRYDDSAFAYLYENYKGALYVQITQVIGVEETASDVLQETFVQVWKNIAKYDPGKGRLFTWMTRLCRNVIVDQLRKRNYKVHDQNENISDYVTLLEKPESFDKEQNFSSIRQHLNNLAPELKNIIDLFYFQGFKQDEIAKGLNLPLGTVKTKIRSGIRELRKNFFNE